MKMKSVCTLALAMSLTLTPMTSLKATSRVDEMLASMSIDQKIGQMLMPDFRQWKQSGETKATDFTVMNNEVKEIIDRYDFGGVILFANNVKQTEQTLKLTNDLQSAAITNTAGNGNIPLLLTIDQEGGIVYRLGSGTALPGNMAVGATGSTQLANDVGEVVGRELNALGINVNFAPVFDTNNNPNNPVIGLRSFSSDPNIVAKLGVPMMQGMQKYNVATAAKHFPGHGDTATDSHTGLPKVDKSLAQLQAMELIPFQAAVNHGVDMLMTAHIQYPQIEKDQVVSKLDQSKIYVPATLSDDVITGIVRNQMKYDGIVVTDALNMDAISKHFGEAEAVIMAIKADVDILLMPTILRSEADLAKIDTIIAEVKKAIEAGEIDMQTIDKSVKRILTLKEKRGILDYSKDTRTWEEKLAFANAQVGSKQNRDIEREVAASAVTVVKDDNQVLPLKPKAKEKVLLLGAYNNELPGMELSMRRLIDEKVLDSSVEYKAVRYNKDSTAASLKTEIDAADYVVVISEVGSASQMKKTHWVTRVPTEVVDYANSVNKTCVVMSISKPYDVANYPNAKAVVAVYGNKGMDPTEGLAPDNAFGPNIPAGVEVIFGGHDAVGSLPVDINEFKDSSYTDKVVYPIGHGIKYRVNVNKDALVQFVTEVKDVNAKEYTKVSYDAFKNALDVANEVVSNRTYTQAEVDATLAGLKEAYANLVKLGDKTALNKVVTEASKLVEKDFKAESWKQFATALQTAKAVLANDQASQVEVDQATETLTKAMKELEKNVIKPTPDKKPSVEDQTNTGDHTNLAKLVTLAGVSLGAVYFVMRNRNKE